jgi:hypothetical protein
MMKRFLCVLIPFCALWMPRADAEEPRTLGWDELSVKVSAADNPFATLSTEQLLALSDVAGLRTRKARGVTLTPEEVAIEKKALTKLKQDRIDVDGLLEKRDAIADKKRAAASAVNPAIDGKLIIRRRLSPTRSCTSSPIRPSTYGACSTPCGSRAASLRPGASGRWKSLTGRPISTSGTRCTRASWNPIGSRLAAGLNPSCNRPAAALTPKKGAASGGPVSTSFYPNDFFKPG